MYTGQYKPQDFDDQSNSSYQYGNPSSDTNPYGYIDHVVKEGETLGDLAKKYGTSEEKIIAANNGENGQWGKYDRSKGWLYKGETLKIPVKQEKEQEYTGPTYQWSIPSPPPSSTRLEMGDYVHGYLYDHLVEDRDVWQNMAGTNALSEEELENIEVYIFYVDDFESQSRKLGRDAVEEFGSDRVAITEMPNAERFSELWGQMRGTPSIIMINTHGKNQSITTGHGSAEEQLTATGNGETNISETKVMDIQDLPIPHADLSGTQLQLNSCHSNDTEPNAHLEGDHHQGDLKGTKQTAARAFLETFGFREVRGTKEAVNYVDWYNTGWWYGIDDDWEQGDPYPDNGEWEFISIDENGNVITNTQEID
jgi:hypothetical protein